MRSRFLTDSDRYAVNLDLKIEKDSITINYVGFNTVGIQEKINEPFKDADGKYVDNYIDNYREELVALPTQTIVLLLSDLQNLSNWNSGSVISIICDAASKEFKGFINDTAESFPSRRAGQTSAINNRDSLSLIRLMLPFDDADFSEIGIQVIQKKGHEFNVSGEVAFTFTDYPDSGEERRKQFREFIPVITIEGPNTVQVSEAQPFTFIAKQNGSFLTKPLTIYTKATAGYLSKEKITLKNGKGTVSLRALDLEKGDTIDLKAGFKYLSSRVKKTIEVI